MPLNENPFFLPVMQSIDMIAGENARQQAEGRLEERQIASEDRAVVREEERFQRGQDVDEFGGLTNFITDYEKNVKAGAEPDAELLKGVVDRRNALIQEGINPQMLATAPQVPAQPKEDGKQGEDMVLLSPDAAAFYGYGADQPVKRETKRILESNFRNYHKPSDKGGGADKDDPLTIITNMRKRSQAIWDKGVMGKGDDWREGIGQDILSEYQADLQDIEQDYRTGLISKAEARIKAVQLGSFDQFLALHGADRNQMTQEIKELKDIFKQTVED